MISVRLATNADQEVVIPMVNEVYFTSEREFWKEGYYRIGKSQFQNYIEQKWLFIAREEDIIVGCILMKPVDNTTTSFSMLVCHPKYRRRGIGKLLVDHIFKTAIENGYTKMQLEILSPLHWVHEEKEFLKSWYVSLGFRLIKEVNFLDYYPTHDKFMKCPLLFSLYEKDL